MSTPRGGRGGERGRGAQGGSGINRGGAGRGRGNGVPANNNTERPAQAIYQRGGARGGNNTITRGSTNARANTRGRGNFANGNISSLNPTSGSNSTPFAQDDYSKRLEHIRAARPLLRERFIREGRMNPEGQMRLSDSVKLFGICTDMCPEYERVRRIVEDDVKPPECTPETEHLPRKQRKPDETRMVKAYARSAAGMDVELVSEIRSPATCLKTLDYLMQRLDNDEFDFLHSWIWDRTRAIRKDLRTQRIEQRSEINLLLTCLERSARFLLLSTHQMARTKKEDYSHQQDIEQLNQTLMSLRERYADNRRVGYSSENEAEFWAYRLILAPLFTNTQLENELHRLPLDLRNNPRVQTAIEIYRVLKSVIFTKTTSFVQAQANWKRFWELIKSSSVSYLMACAAEVSFQRVRHVVLDALWRVYRMGTSRNPHTVETWTIDQVKGVLGLDTEFEAVHLCEAYGFSFGQTKDGQQFLDVTKKGFERKPLDLPANLSQQTFSQGIVEVKRCNRAFSAVVQAMSVQEAKSHGLMIESTSGMPAGEEMEDETTLFVPEAPPAKSNVFMQPNGTLKGTLATSSVSDPATNPFIKNSVPSFQAFPRIGSANVQPGVFDPSKNDIKFASSKTTSTPLANLKNPTLLTPASSTTQATPSAATNSAPSTGHNFFSGAAKALAQQPAATTTTTAPNLFGFAGVPSSVSQAHSPNPALSFTPAGSPAPLLSVSHDEEKRKVEEEKQRRKAELEALAQQRAREEQARQAREAAERQRLEAERERQRVQQEERNRVIQEARERQQREEEARIAKLQARETAYTSLTADLMWDIEEGLMLQFIENLASNMAEEVMAAEEEKKRRILEEKKVALLKANFEQRELAFKRSVMATWIAKVEKKKRARQAKDRRRRLKEQKTRIMNAEETPDVSPHGEPQATADTPNHEGVFHKPQAPASARRGKRTEERRGVQTSHQNGISDTVSRPTVSEHQIAVQTVLTPVSMSNSLDSSAGYSEAYQKFTAPIDRTETDYFILRAQGLDPSRHRKRSFDSSSSEEEQLTIEPKRQKLIPSERDRPSLPPMTTTEEHEARLRALQQRRMEKYGVSHQPVNGTAFVDRGSPPLTRVGSLAKQGRQLLGGKSSPKPSPPNLKHDWGRSVPNLGLSASSTARHSLLSRSVGTAATKGRPAFYDRKSRFVPQHLYGHGGKVARAYREQLNSPPDTRPCSVEPLAVSSPIPTQMYPNPPNGYTQEQYSDKEEFSSVEVIDADAEDEDVATTEEEYEGDEETEEEDDHPPQPDRRQSEHAQYEDEDGDSLMSGDDLVKYSNGYMNGHDGYYEDEVEQDYEEYTEEDEDMDGDEEDNSDTQQHHFAQPTQRAQPVQPPQCGKQAPQQPPKEAGNTEDDAIELSD